MLNRCYRVVDINYDNYGGRGIKVCERWRKFENFYADLGERPAGLTLGRILNDGDYEPGNCEWMTTAQQHRNTRRSRRITFNGETLVLVEWAEKFNVHEDILSDRLKRHSVEVVFGKLSKGERQWP
jgi:hypothetical protein